MSSSFMPIVAVDSVDRARAFYVEKLGFQHQMGLVGKDGEFDFCTVFLGEAKLMFMRPPEHTPASEPADQRPVQMYFPVEGIDAYHDQIVGGGVTVKKALETEWWGDRTFIVVDPYGYDLWFYETVGEPKPLPGMKLV